MILNTLTGGSFICRNKYSRCAYCMMILCFSRASLKFVVDCVSNRQLVMWNYLVIAVIKFFICNRSYLLILKVFCLRRVYTCKLVPIYLCALSVDLQPIYILSVHHSTTTLLWLCHGSSVLTQYSCTLRQLYSLHRHSLLARASPTAIGDHDNYYRQ